MHPTLPRIRLPRGRMAKIVLGVAAAAALAMALAAWQVPRLVRDALTGQVAGMIGRDVRAGDISFNPFTLTLRVLDLQVEQPEGEPLLRVAGLEASAAWSSLLRLAPVIDRLHVREPQLALVRDGPRHFNFSDIVERLAGLAADDPPQPEDERGLPRFSLNNLELDDGSVTLDDQVTGRRHVVDRIGLGVPFVSNFGYATDIDVEPRLQARINGSTFAMDGKARPFDEVPRSTLNLAFLGLELDRFADAWPAPLPVAVQRAMLDANLEVAFEQPRDGPARLRVSGDMAMRGLDLRQPGGQPLLQWDALTLRGIDAEPLAQRLHVAGIDLRSPQVHGERYENQRINWLDVVEGFGRMAAGGPATPAESPAPPASPAAPGESPAASTPPQPSPWQISIDAVEIEGGAMQWRDAVLPLDYGLTDLALATGPIVLPQPAGQPVRMTLSAGDTAGGKLGARGTLALAPLAAELELHADAIALPAFAAAVRKAAPMQLEDGRAAVKARLTLAQRDAAMQVSLHDIHATLESLAVRDESVEPAVALRLARLALAADRYDLAGGTTAFTLDAAGLQGGGTLAAKGSYAQTPMAVQADVDLRGLDLASLSPYVASSLNATVRAVTVGARGKLAFAAASGSSPMKLDWAGDAEVSGLDLQDRVNRADFLKWKNLAFAGMKVALAGEQVRAHLGRVTLDDFFGRVILNTEGRLNVMDLVAGPGRAGGSITQDTQTRSAPARPAAGPAPDISVAGITLRGGRMVFTDRFVKPNYTAELSGIGGSVGAVSSTSPTPAKVDVSGRVYRTAPFSISGTVQPFAKFLALDLKATAQGVDLPRFTTYSAKYMGYPITRGKLSLDVEYRIEDRQLTARNRVVLNQLTLGERTDSPDALKLPVTLAIALLKDSRGNIDINLPVSGSLDDPQFSVGGIILRVFVNLITRAVTAPFSLLASAFGSGEELSYVAFEPGSARLDAQAQEQIATLAKALGDRPSLRLDISGRVDPQADEAGLRRAWLERRLREAKAREASTRSNKVDPAAVTVAQAERAQYLEEVYDDTDIEDKPRNFIGMAKSVPPEQMEAMLLAAAPVDEERLRRLADARAQAVYEKLQQAGPADRIFVVASRLDASGVDDGGTASRVDFALK